MTTYKLGRRPPSNKPALKLADILTGQVPAHPATGDHFGQLEFGLYGNDRFGDCGPTSVANLVRLVSAGLTGAMVAPSQDDVFDLYRRSGNPGFDPQTDADDNGVDMQTMLEALLKGGIGDGQGGVVKPVAFAKVDPTSDDELTAAVSIFGGVLWGVDLMTAQQTQTDAKPPKWDYQRSGEWGGHAIVNGSYETGSVQDVISWAIRVETTSGFRKRQLQEAWVVVWPWNIDHPAFQQGVDLNALEVAYQSLTGKVLPLPFPNPSPSPVPAPSPAGETVTTADKVLAATVGQWAHARHSTPATKSVAAGLLAWMKAKQIT